MRATTLVATMLLVAALLSLAPAASAEEDKHCIQDCNWLENLVWDTVDDTKQTAKDLTAPPCLCDPQPDPGP